MPQLIAITVALILIVMGLFIGAEFINAARVNEMELSKVAPATLDMNYLSLPIYHPMKVRSGGHYTVEVFLDESVYAWLTSSFTQSAVLTTSLVVDPRLVRSDGNCVVTSTLKPDQPIFVADPIVFGFHVREDILISDTLEIGLRLDVEGQAPEVAGFTVPVYETGDLWREYWWRILWFGASVTVLAVTLVALGLTCPPVGIVEILIVIIAAAIWYPELFETIKLILGTLKEIL